MVTIGDDQRQYEARIDEHRRPRDRSGARPARSAGSLRTVLGYVDADIAESACAHIPVGRPDIGPDGLVTDAATRERILASVQALAAHAESAASQDL